MKSNRNLFQAVRMYKFQSLFIKSLILIFLLVIVPFTGMSLVVYYQMNKAVEAEVSDVNMNSLYRVKDITDNIFDQMDHIALELVNQDDVASFLLASNVHDTSPDKMKNIHTKISMYTRSFKFMDSLYIYSSRSNYILSNRLDASDASYETFDDKTWYDDVYRKLNADHSYMQSRKRNGLYPYYISITRPAIYGTMTGAVTANIDIEELRKFLTQTSDQFENTYILSGNHVLYSHNRNEFMSNIDTVDLLKDVGNISSNEPSSSFKLIHGQKYIFSVLPSKKQNLTYISLLPLNHYEQKINKLGKFLFVYFVVGAVVVLAVSLLISIRTFSPVNQIMSMIEDQEKVQHLMGTSEKRKWNELRVIASSIFRTLDAKKGLEQELQLRLQSLREAQTVALQNQTTPHFLYNTLESIKYLSLDLTKGRNRVSDMVTELSDLLRRSLDTDHPLTEIGDELEHAKKYINIMQARYPNKFEVIWAIQDDILTCQILKISLQPLLENAFEHGILPARRPGRLEINGRQTVDGIQITVSDNGAGIPEDILMQLGESLNGGVKLGEKHIGLKNLNQRIKLIFGDSYGLTITSLQGQGTTVTIKIPFDSGISASP